MSAPLAAQVDAHRVATRDRECAANLRLNAAVKTAAAIIRLGRKHDDPSAVDEATRVLTIAGESAARVLGEAS